MINALIGVPATGDSGLKMIIVVMVIVLLIIIAMAIFLFRNNKKNAIESDAAVSSVTPEASPDTESKDDGDSSDHTI